MFAEYGMSIDSYGVLIKQPVPVSFNTKHPGLCCAGADVNDHETGAELKFLFSTDILVRRDFISVNNHIQLY